MLKNYVICIVCLFKYYLSTMKKGILLTILFIVFVLNVHAQLRAGFSHSAFFSQNHIAYMETYLNVVGKSVKFVKNESGKYYGQVEVGILFSQKGQIKSSGKFILKSPEQNDTLMKPDFMDVQRFKLDTGEYDLEVFISDINVQHKVLSLKENVKVVFLPNRVSLSEIETLTSFNKTDTITSLTKNGYNLIPYMSDFYPEEIKELNFYVEVYGTKEVFGENEKYLISYFISSYENQNKMESFIGFKKETSAPVNILLTKLNISDLPGGNYDLTIEVRNKLNQIVAIRTLFFTRKNLLAKSILNDDLSSVHIENTFVLKIRGVDTLQDFLRSLKPIASRSEQQFIDNQLKKSDSTLLRQFLYNFWRNRSLFSAEEAWNKYHQKVIAVNAKYRTFTYRGYETDRGRVYLQYGQPDKITESPLEPNAYPYEIWSYYRLEDNSQLHPRQTNKQFIFYNPEQSTNNYILLHTNAIGEVYDARWEMKLHQRSVQSNDFEMKNSPEHFGGHADEDFSNPK